MPLAGKGAYGLGRVDLPEGFKHDGVVYHFANAYVSATEAKVTLRSLDPRVPPVTAEWNHDLGDVKPKAALENLIDMLFRGAVPAYEFMASRVPV